jgi:hypothetical protein
LEWCRQGEIKALIEEKNLSQHNFVHPKPQTDWPEIVIRPPQLRTKPELYVKTEYGPRGDYNQLQVSIRCREITPALPEILKIHIYTINWWNSNYKFLNFVNVTKITPNRINKERSCVLQHRVVWYDAVIL